MPDVEAELRARAESDGVEFFFAMFVDMHGKPCAKMIPATALDVLLGGAGFAGFAAGPMGQSPADPDMIAVPDPASYTLVPWQPGLAVLQCDIAVEGEPWPYTPRLILKGMLAKARERGYVYNVGCEAEYFLVRRRDEGGIELADPLDRAGVPCYDAKGLTRMFDHLSTVSRYMNQLGWANYANDHEDANGQFEQNFAVLRRAHVRRPADLLPLHGAHARAPGGHGRHLHAEAVREPHRLRAASAFEPVGRAVGGGAVRRPRRPAWARPVGARVPLHRRAGRARPGDGGGHLPDGQLLQALRGRRAAVRRHLGPGLRHLRRQQPHPDAAGARGRPGGEPWLRRLGQPVPGDGGAAGRRARRHRPRPRPGRAEPRQPARPVRRRGGQPGDPGAAADPAARGRRAGYRRRAARGAGQDARTATTSITTQRSSARSSMPGTPS